MIEKKNSIIFHPEFYNYIVYLNIVGRFLNGFNAILMLGMK